MTKLNTIGRTAASFLKKWDLLLKMMEFEVIRESAKIWEGRRVECPKVLVTPSEVGGVLQIHLDIFGQIFVLGKVTHFDDDETVHVVLESYVGKFELKHAPLSLQKAPAKKIGIKKLENSRNIHSLKENSERTFSILKNVIQSNCMNLHACELHAFELLNCMHYF
ncbi:hypothetical protein CEXT_769601 [Caerostris extrusa]|uniref:Uncharacterized protein n=1 Tax=Caerostris extrusa TaxID=172846 RepID=A0AAV4U3E3_CAEEX|nr:hypothetical protein CEXT_769601 [Caerostris extrusa]